MSLPEFVSGPSIEGAGGHAVAVPVFADRGWGPGAEELLGGQISDAHLDGIRRRLGYL